MFDTSWVDHDGHIMRWLTKISHPFKNREHVLGETLFWSNNASFVPLVDSYVHLVITCQKSTIYFFVKLSCSRIITLFNLLVQVLKAYVDLMQSLHMQSMYYLQWKFPIRCKYAMSWKRFFYVYFFLRHISFL